jgi:hypothetical protein
MTDNYIETYISSIKNINTKETFRRFLLNLSKEIDPYQSSEEQLWDFIENKKNVKIETKRHYQYIIKGFRKFHNLFTDYLSFKLKKDNNGRYVNSDNQQEEVKISKTLPDDYRDLINNIENPNHKLLLRLLTDYDEVLRGDLSNVKMSQINDGVILIEETLKTKKRIEIKIKQEDLVLLDWSKEFLIHMEPKDINKRSNAYSKLLRRITKKYLGVLLTVNDFRHISTTKGLKKIEHLPLREQQVLLKEQASKRAHSSSVAISNYLNDTNDINVSLDYKKTINILRGDTVIESYNLEEVIKVMNLYRGIKDLF